jgi:hypothetical protein
MMDHQNDLNLARKFADLDELSVMFERDKRTIER